MSFTLRDDQKALQQGIQDFCTNRFPRDQLGAIDAWSFDRGLWSDLREMGVFALQVPEDDGGLGLDDRCQQEKNGCYDPDPLHGNPPWVSYAGDGRWFPPFRRLSFPRALSWR